MYPTQGISQSDLLVDFVAVDIRVAASVQPLE